MKKAEIIRYLKVRVEDLTSDIEMEHTYIETEEKLLLMGKREAYEDALTLLTGKK